MEFKGRIAGFGADGGLDFLISSGDPGDGVHLALSSPDRETVDAFHATALDAGGTDNGKPGLRPGYHANYHGTFILDSDGHNIEAVCHTLEACLRR